MTRVAQNHESGSNNFALKPPLQTILRALQLEVKLHPEDLPRPPASLFNITLPPHCLAPCRAVHARGCSAALRTIFLPASVVFLPARHPQLGRMHRSSSVIESNISKVAIALLSASRWHALQCSFSRIVGLAPRRTTSPDCVPCLSMACTRRESVHSSSCSFTHSCRCMQPMNLFVRGRGCDNVDCSQCNDAQYVCHFAQAKPRAE